MGRPLGPQFTGMPFQTQFAPRPGSAAPRDVEGQVVGDEEVEAAVAVVVDEAAARAPAHAADGQPRRAR